jgi:hypothetical protein
MAVGKDLPTIAKLDQMVKQTARAAQLLAYGDPQMLRGVATASVANLQALLRYLTNPAANTAVALAAVQLLDQISCQPLGLEPTLLPTDFMPSSGAIPG